MHSLLSRQLRRAHGVNQLEVSDLSPQWQAFVAMVEQAYNDNEADLALVQRSIDIASGELVERNQKLLQQNARLQLVDQEVRRSRDELELNVALRTAELSEAKDAAERIKEHFQLLLDSTGEGIYGINAAGICTFANIAAVKMLGYTVNEWIGQNMHDLIHFKHIDGSPHPVSECPIYLSIHQGQSCRIHEDVFWTRDSTSVPVEYSAYPLHVGGQVVGSVVAFSDIRVRKQVELELRRAKELAEHASQTKSEFLARMSHEIRTPLNGVVGMIDQLGHTQLTEQQERYTALARMAAQSLMSVINDILDFSKLEAGKTQIDSIEFDVNQMVQGLVELFAPEARKKNLELTCNLPTNIPTRLLGDCNRIRQVFTNLISNAIKFTASGSIRVSVALQSRQPDDCVICAEVADTGMGIPADRLDQLFQRFSQLDSSITRQFGGTGLGLAICKRLVELMGGQIGVRSEEKRGTTFWLTIPLALVPQNGAHQATNVLHSSNNPNRQADSNLHAVKGLHVLVAEDNEMNQFVTQETLKYAGCTSEVAADGAQAVEAFKRGNYHMILMDCQMPDVDGLEATRRIRQIESSAGKPNRIPIVALTAEAIAGDRERCLAAGMDGYVSKPINPVDLFAELARLAHLHRRGSNSEIPKFAVPTAGSSREPLAEIVPAIHR
jgi:PAS domain S-box-containing protein